MKTDKKIAIFADNGKICTSFVQPCGLGRGYELSHLLTIRAVSGFPPLRKQAFCGRRDSAARPSSACAIPWRGSPCKKWTAAVGPLSRRAVSGFPPLRSRLSAGGKPKTAGRFRDQLPYSLRRRRDSAARPSSACAIPWRGVLAKNGRQLSGRCPARPFPASLPCESKLSAGGKPKTAGRFRDQLPYSLRRRRDSAARLIPALQSDSRNQRQ